jgi:hypothetical protein
MHHSDHPLSSAIEQLQSLNPNDPATLAELAALSAARDCIDELLRTCVAELRADPENAASWPAIAAALRSSSASAAQQPTSTKPPAATAAWLANATADGQILSFWQAFAELFAWDFLPVDFLHALYADWMSQEFPTDTHLLKKAFTRRIKAVATASGEWLYTRSRPGSMMNAPEPLCARVPGWTRNRSDVAQYGLRRSKSATITR